MDSLESAVDENVRTPPEINGAKRKGLLRTGGGGGARVVSAMGDFFRFQLDLIERVAVYLRPRLFRQPFVFRWN